VVDASDPKDLAALAEGLPKLVGIGMQIPVTWAHEQLRIPVADKGEAVLTAPVGAAPTPRQNPEDDAAPAATPETGLTALRAGKPDDIPAVDPRVLTRLAAQAQPAVQAMIEQIRAMLAKADSLEEAMAMLEAAYPDIDAGPLAQAMTQAGLVAQLAGRVDVLQEVAGASR
jgi:phage gp29-like protein